MNYGYLFSAQIVNQLVNFRLILFSNEQWTIGVGGAQKMRKQLNIFVYFKCLRST